MILFGVEKEMLGMTTLKIRAVLAWIWLHTNNCSDLRNVWQQFITRIYTELCWPVWPGTYVMQKYVFFLRWC